MKKLGGTLFIPHMDPGNFVYLQEWIANKGFELPPNSGGTDSSVFWSILSKAYVAAEAMRATNLKRYIIDTVYSSIKGMGCGPTSEVIRLIYENTTVTSEGRRITVTFFIWQAAEWWWIKDKDDDAIGTTKTCLNSSGTRSLLQAVREFTC